MADVTMVCGPLCIFCAGATRVRRRMEVIACVVTAGVAIPATLPHALSAFLLIVDGKIVVAITTDLNPSQTQPSG
ncbi:hypothetical protein GJ634_08130 [Halobacterium sp. CBA1126]|nr:hypothetical protein [Halobacterium sp. CBA1126]